MPWTYLRTGGQLQTPQFEPIPGSTQERNEAGGFAWKIDSMERLRRFLILGSEGGTYYASERKLTRENIDGVRAALDEHKTQAVGEIVRISNDGRAPKNDPALYALAIACAHSNEEVRKAALSAIPQVARIGTHLFHFAEFVQSQRGWGRGLRKAIAAWYESERLDRLAYQAVKYRQRDGWTHRDLLRLAHPSAPTPEHKTLYDFICGRGVALELPGILAPVMAYRDAQAAPSPQTAATTLTNYGPQLPREALKTEHLDSPEVWTALLEVGMPMTALIRNLANMTRIGVLRPMSKETQVVIEQLTNQEQLRRSRVHPLTLLNALMTYARGQGRGSAWTPLREIVDALDAAFYLAFGNVKPTNKRTLLALDVSSSMMSGALAGLYAITPRVGGAAMSLITAATEPNYYICGFCHDFVDLDISPRMRLDDVVRKTSGLPFGGTDCALPMMEAMKRQIPIDSFIVYTDNETWAGAIHPVQALNEYRKRMGIDAKLVVVGMTAGNFSIADPNDRGMLDVVGFDSAAPNVISDFLRD